MEERGYYEKLFANYPDVVTLPEFCKMLGGIGDSAARKLMRGNHVHHFYIRHTYLIPKKRASLITFSALTTENTARS